MENRIKVLNLPCKTSIFVTLNDNSIFEAFLINLDCNTTLFVNTPTKLCSFTIDTKFASKLEKQLKELEKERIKQNFEFLKQQIFGISIDFTKDREKLKQVFNLSDRVLNKLRKYVKRDNFVLTYNLLQKVRYHLPKKEKERKLNKIEYLLNNELELLQSIFCSYIHVDESMSFSTCYDWCDDCRYIAVIDKKYLDNEVKKYTERIYIKSPYDYSKVYTYYEPNEKVLKILKMKYKEMVEEKIRDLKELKENLERRW